MVGKKIALINSSTAATDADAEKWAAALQIQSKRDFAPFWGVSADITFVPKGAKIPTGTWQLALLDNSDAAGALGYHDVTPDGLPAGKAFVGTDIQYGYKPSVTISHELLEMLADPDINQTVFLQTADVKGRLYAKEVCDAVEADALGYDIDGVTVSDFVTQQWFETFNHSKGTRYSFMKHVSKPFELAPGGYIGVFDVTRGSGWKQVTAKSTDQMLAEMGSSLMAETLFRQVSPVGSRRERRARFWNGAMPLRSTRLVA